MLEVEHSRDNEDHRSSKIIAVMEKDQALIDFNHSSSLNVNAMSNDENKSYR